MAFPVARSARAGIVTANATSWTLTYPGAGDILDGGGSAIVAGDLILVNIGRDGTSGTGSITGFTPLFDQTDGSARGLTLAKVADGTETGTFTYTVGASEQGAWRVSVYKVWHGTISGGVEALGLATGSTANPDPASASPSWGSADNLWRAVCAHDGGAPTITAYPTNYTLNQDSDQSGGGNGAGLGGASRQLATGTEDPGAFTMSAADGWIAWVVVIRGGVDARSGAATAVSHTNSTAASGSKQRSGAATNVTHTSSTAASGSKGASGAATGLTNASSTSATGRKDGQGTAALTNASSTSATGGGSGSADAPHAHTTSATGSKQGFGTADVSHTHATAATGEKPTFDKSGAATPVSHASSTAAAGTAGMAGTASTSSVHGATASGTKDGTGTASGANTHTADATGASGRLGAASAVHASSTDGTGTHAGTGTASVTITHSTAATGTGPSPDKSGAATPVSVASSTSATGATGREDSAALVNASSVAASGAHAGAGSIAIILTTQPDTGGFKDVFGDGFVVIASTTAASGYAALPASRVHVTPGDALVGATSVGDTRVPAATVGDAVAGSVTVGDS